MKNVSSAKSAEAKAVVLSNVANKKNETAPLIVLPSLPTEEETKEQVLQHGRRRTRRDFSPVSLYGTFKSGWQTHQCLREGDE